MDHDIQRNADGTACSSARGPPTSRCCKRARARLRRRRHHHSKYDDRPHPRGAQQRRCGPQGRQDALTENAAGVRAPECPRRARSASSARTSGRTTSSRYLSVEATTTEAAFDDDGGSTSGPPLVADVFDAAGNRIGGGNLQVIDDNELDGRVPLPRHAVRPVGIKSAGGPDPASVRVASSNGDVDTLDAKRWIAKDPPKPTAPLSGFVTHYNDSQEAYKKMRDLAAEFPTISEAVKLPEQTRGYQRKAQTMLGYMNVRRARRPTHRTRRRRTSGSTPTTCRSPAPRRPRPSRPARSS